MQPIDRGSECPRCALCRQRLEDDAPRREMTVFRSLTQAAAIVESGRLLICHACASGSSDKERAARHSTPASASPFSGWAA